MSNNYVVIKSDKNKKTTMILCCLGFIGLGGLHDFYLGNFGKGLIKLCTINWFLIGSVIDIIKISMGQYKDGCGAPIKE